MRRIGCLKGKGLFTDDASASRFVCTLRFDVLMTGALEELEFGDLIAELEEDIEGKEKFVRFVRSARSLPRPSSTRAWSGSSLVYPFNPFLTTLRSNGLGLQATART